MRRATFFTAISLLTLFAGLSPALAAESVRSVTVGGLGEIQAEPDKALVTLGVEARKPRMEDARAEVSRVVDAILKLTRDLKIDARLVRATRINVQPEYDWNNQNRERTLLGYYVSRQVQVDLRDLDKLGTLLERAVDLGANQLNEPQLDSSRRHDLEREALAKAVADARLNAETLARAAGATLGAVRMLSASSGVVGPPMPMVRMAAMKAEADSAAGSYQSGQMTFTGTVQAEYDLLPANP